MVGFAVGANVGLAVGDVVGRAAEKCQVGE
jgi:hypothetical protein